MDRTEESLATYDQVLAEAEKVDPERKVGILSDKAEVYWKAKRYQESLDIHDALLKLMEPSTMRWVDEQAWRIRILARMGRADDAWRAYDELAKASTTPPQGRLNMMAVIALHLQQSGATTAAREAALKTKEYMATHRDPSVDPAEAERLIDKVLSAETADKQPHDEVEKSKP